MMITGSRLRRGGGGAPNAGAGWPIPAPPGRPSPGSGGRRRGGVVHAGTPSGGGPLQSGGGPAGGVSGCCSGWPAGRAGSIAEPDRSDPWVSPQLTMPAGDGGCSASISVVRPLGQPSATSRSASIPARGDRQADLRCRVVPLAAGLAMRCDPGATFSRATHRGRGAASGSEGKDATVLRLSHAELHLRGRGGSRSLRASRVVRPAGRAGRVRHGDGHGPLLPDRGSSAPNRNRCWRPTRRSEPWPPGPTRSCSGRWCRA